MINNRIIIIIIIFYLIIKKFNKKKEHFAIIDQVNSSLKDLYNTDMDTIRKLSNTIIALENGNVTINGNFNVTGSFNYLPKGTILAHNQTTAPSGWALCNGTNGTPDLRGRFILGAGQGANLTNRNINQLAGTETHTLTIDQMPQHNHGGTTNTTGNHSHRADGFPDWGSLCWRNGGCAGFLNSGGATHCENTTTSGNHSHTIPNQGGNQPHNNMPPFFVLTYIMKL